MAFVDAIGIISGLLTIVSFGIDNFSTDPPAGSDVRFAIALDGGNSGTSNAGGDLPDVRIFNDFGEETGITVDPGYVSDGNSKAVHVGHDNQAVYTLLSANNDAICIAFVTISSDADRGGNKYAVSGDYGKQCGATWYASHYYTSSKRDYQPACFWIDANGDQPSTGFQVRWPTYSESEFNSGESPNNFCNNIDFGVRYENDPNGINYYVKRDGQDQPQARANTTSMVRREWMETQLVISDSKFHSAQDLCDSDTSFGPDFAHVGEDKMCDMGTKTLYKFCSDKTTTNCFDLDNKTLVGGRYHVAAAAKVASPYQSIRDWRESS